MRGGLPERLLKEFNRLKINKTCVYFVKNIDLDKKEEVEEISLSEEHEHDGDMSVHTLTDIHGSKNCRSLLQVNVFLNRKGIST